MHIAQQIIWRKKLEECEKIPIYTYFEKQYDEIFPLDIIFFRNDAMCTQLTRATTRDAIHFKLMSLQGRAPKLHKQKFIVSINMNK